MSLGAADMSANDKITVLDFTAGVVRKTTRLAWIRERNRDCRRSGHIFVSMYPHEPEVGDKCICGDTRWPRPPAQPGVGE